MDAQQIFNNIFNGQTNHLTPNVISTGMTAGQDCAYELASGDDMFGVTVARLVGGVWVISQEDGDGFEDEESALEYIGTL